MANGHRGARGSRMAKHWHELPAGAVTLTANATAFVGALALDGPWTAIRMLGEYVFAPTGGGAFAASDNALLALAIGVISTDAAALGSSAVPDPADEPDYPWLYWAEHPLLFLVATADQNNPAGVVRVSFDIRSMRKIKPRESLSMIIQYTDVSGTPPISFSAAHTRVLVAT